MRTVPVTDAMLERYHSPTERAVRRTFKDSPDMETDPCEAVVHRDPGDGITAIVTVPWELTAEEAEALIGGGTIMLSTWGGLPPHRLDVVAAPQPVGRVR